MKLILTILLIVTFNYSITAQENTDSLMNAFIPAKKTAVFYKNKTIQFKTNDSINPDYEIISGKSLVFEYDFHSKDIISMSDDEVSEKILFEVKPRSKSFYLADKKLTQAHLMFMQSCFCMDAGNYVIKSGFINGTKISNNTWKVKFKFTYIARNTKNKVTKNFTIKFKLAK